MKKRNKIVLLCAVLLFFFACEEKKAPLLWAEIEDTSILQNTAEWNAAFEKAKKYGIGGIFIKASPTEIKELISLANKHDLQIYAKIEMLKCNDPEVLESHASWFSVNRLKQSIDSLSLYATDYNYLCPHLPEVQNYLLEKIASYQNIEGLEGVYLSEMKYIENKLPEGLQPRYGVVQSKVHPQYDFGYHEFTVEKFREKFQKAPTSLQKEEVKKWDDFRTEILTNLVAKLKKELEETDLKLSVEVYPEPQVAKEIAKQDWVNWEIDFAVRPVFSEFYQKKENKSWEFLLSSTPEKSSIFIVDMRDTSFFEELAGDEVKEKNVRLLIDQFFSLTTKELERLVDLKRKFEK